MFPSLVRGDQTMFRSNGARKDFLRGRAFYKHLAPNGAKRNNVLLHRPGRSQLRSFTLARSSHRQDGAYSEVALRPDYSVAPSGAG
jgi:hypothetical protein